MYGCNARIITQDGCLIETRGSHRNVTHKAWTSDQITKHRLEQKIIKKVRDENKSPHEAYNDVARDHPNKIQVFSGWQDCRNKAHNARQKSGFILPKPCQEISTTLNNCGLTLNHYGQKLLLQRYDESTTTSEQIEEWKSKSCKMYLGCVGAGEIQVFCCEDGAKILKTAPNIHFDVSFKATPKISPTSTETIPYKGALHLLAVFDPINVTQTPMAVPCATLLFKAAKPDADTYDLGLQYLRDQCIETHDVNIINMKQNIIGMGDYERPLRIAINRHWTQMIMKACLFHYSQALNSNIGDKGLQSLYQSTGKNHNFQFYCFIRNFHVLPLLPPSLVPRGWNLLAGCYKSYTPPKFQENCLRWLMYHKNYWMKNGEFIKEWNCYRSSIRTNNSLECRNNLVNVKFGAHPFLFEFVWKLGEWFAIGFVNFEQFVKHKKGNKKHPREILKEQVLLKLWDFIDNHQSDADILSFLKTTSKALKANKKTLQKML